jgi:hypothetical protein
MVQIFTGWGRGKLLIMGGLQLKRILKSLLEKEFSDIDFEFFQSDIEGEIVAV